MKKPFAWIAGTVLVTSLLIGATAGCGSGAGNVPLEYHYYHSEKDESGALREYDYNHERVYENDLQTLGADPSAIYVTEGEEAGYYYMYNTSDPIGATGYLAYRSKNLNDWECMGVAYNPTMYIEKDVTYTAFATSMYWAPEVIYDAQLGLYFMFYNASYLFKPYTFYIDVAVSEKPQGPFVQYAKWKYDNGTAEEKEAWAPVLDDAAAVQSGLGAGKLKVFKPVLDFSKIPQGTKIDESWQKGDVLKSGELPGYMKVIDASPFIDEDGEKYLYFVQDLGDKHSTSAIAVIKMNDDWTPDYTQLKKLTAAQQIDLDTAADTALNEGSVNEAPFMTKHDGKYYLTFSVHSYTETSYSVRIAVGDSPMGPFKKLTQDEGGYLLSRAGMWASGTGHHSFVTANGATFIVYHAHTDRRLGGSARAIAFDEVVWIQNGSGLTIPHVNGPTYSIMPLITTEWKNIAGDATVRSNGTAEGSDVKYLTDGVVRLHDESFISEYEIATSAVEITLTFDDYREIAGLFLFNGDSYERSVWEISKVEFEFKDGNVTGTAYTDKLEYDYDRYYPGGEYYVKGGTFALEFKPMLVKSIKITLPRAPEEEERALSEIMVLGK